MTSADFSQFVVTARLPFFLKPRLRDLPSYGRTLSGLYPLGLLSAVRIVIGLLLLLQHYPCLPAFYQVLVHRANRLPPASFRFHLTMDTLAFGCNLPTIRAVWGLAPVRVRSCWANYKNGLLAVERAVFEYSLFFNPDKLPFLLALCLRNLLVLIIVLRNILANNLIDTAHLGFLVWNVLNPSKMLHCCCAGAIRKEPVESMR